MSLSRSWAPCCRATPARWTNPLFYRRALTFCTNTKVRHPNPLYLFFCLDENLESGGCLVLTCTWTLFFFFSFQKSLLSQSPLRSGQTGSLLFLVMKSSPSWCWRWELWTVLNYDRDCGCLCFKENIVFCQALDGFFLAIMTDGNIIYASESVTSLLEHLPVSIIWITHEHVYVANSFHANLKILCW